MSDVCEMGEIECILLKYCKDGFWPLLEGLGLFVLNLRGILILKV